MNLWQSPPQGEEPFEALRERLFSNVISLLALLTTVGGLILLMRLYLIGLQPFMLAQAVSLLGVLGLAVVGSRRSIQWRLVALTVCFLLYVTASTVQLGPAADSRGFLLFLAFLAGVFLSPRAGLRVTLFLLLWVVLVGGLAIFWGLPLSLQDYAAYSAHPSTWISMAAVLGTFSGIIGYVGAVLVQQLRQQAEALKHSETRLRGLFQLSPIGIALNDVAAGRFLEVNQALLDMSGYSREAFLDLDYWQLMPLDLARSEQDQLRQLLEQGRFGPFEKELLCQDGQRLPVRVQGMLVTDNEGRRQVWSMIEDIRDEQRLARMQREFVSTVSHELRTPLTSISGALGLVAGGVLGELPRQAGEMVDIALQNSQQLTLLVNDLLDMEKLLAGKMSFDLQRHDLLALVQSALRHNQSYAAQHAVELQLVSPAEASVVVDRLRLEQVLNNLLSNAAKFSPPQGRVEVAISPADGWVRVSVRDHGPGIPQAFRARIFEHFSQADSSDTRQKGGTGLGLAISRQLIERMGGRLAFDSQEGAGSTFYFELPLARELG